MHYAYFSPIKIFFITAITLTLFGSVYYTFSYKDAQFGNVHLGTAIYRVMQKYTLLAWHGARFGAGSLSANALSAFGRTKYESRPEARAVPVLLYHGLRSSDEGAVSPELFAEHMNALHDAGWRTVKLNELEAFLRGEGDLPERSFVLTFDDGARDSYYPVDPVLSLFGYQAATFILPKYSVGPGTHYYLSSGEIKSMLESKRWEIGSHGVNSHEFLPINATGETGAALSNLLWLNEEGRVETLAEFEERVGKEMSESRAALEAEFGVLVPTFAFPFGEFGQHEESETPEIVAAVEKHAGEVYNLSFYQTWQGEGYSHNYPRPDSSGMLMVKRIEPTPKTSAEELLAVLEEGIPKDLPYQDDFETDGGWFSIWGEPAVDGSALALKSLSHETGAAAVLDGTGDWENYRVELELESQSRTGFVVLVRYQDNENNAGCNFGNGFIHAEDVVAGERRVVSGVRNSSIVIPEGSFTVAVEVRGRELTCTLEGGESVSTIFLDESLNRGGVGVKIWDREPGLADLSVHELSVTPL